MLPITCPKCKSSFAIQSHDVNVIWCPFCGIKFNPETLAIQKRTVKSGRVLLTVFLPIAMIGILSFGGWRIYKVIKESNSVSATSPSIMPLKPPKAIKKFVIYKKGRSYILYFGLVDAWNDWTTSAGTARIIIHQGRRILLRKTYRVRKHHFENVTIGKSIFKKEATIWSIKLEYKEFEKPPKFSKYLTTIDAKIIFRLPDGKVLKASTTSFIN